MKIIEKVKKRWQDARFEVEIKNAISRIETTEGVITYPLLVSLKFEQDWYRQRFDDGIPVRESVMVKSEEIGNNLKGSLSKIAEK